MTVPAWSASPYVRIYATLARDYPSVWRDSEALGDYVRLLSAADASFPAPPALPRWLPDDRLTTLVQVGLVRRIGDDYYEIAGLAKERASRATGRQIGGLARVEGAERDASGRFLPAGSDRGESSNTSSNPALLEGTKPSIQPSKPSIQPTKRVAGRPSKSSFTEPSRAEPSRESLKREGEGGLAREAVRHGEDEERPDIVALRTRLGRVSLRQIGTLNEILRRHDESGPQWAADIITACHDPDPLPALWTADRKWQAERRDAAEREERAVHDRQEADKANAPDVLAHLESQIRASRSAA